MDRAPKSSKPNPGKGTISVTRLPSVFRYEVAREGFGLYLGELSTTEGLGLFAPSTPLKLVRFGATGYARLGWATEKELPPLPTAGAMRDFLTENEPIGLIELEAVLGDGVLLSSHDDGECHFRFHDRAEMMDVLLKTAPMSHHGRAVHAILAAQGLYVTIDPDGVVTTFASFDAYVSRMPR